MPNNEDILPNLKLLKRETPLQKISLNKIPKELYEKIESRADQLGKEVPVYCRIVLEHALENKNDYRGRHSTALRNSRTYGEVIHIPLQSLKFLENLEQWDPFGDGKKNKIALNILRKHLEVRSW